MTEKYKKEYFINTFKRREQSGTRRRGKRQKRNTGQLHFNSKYPESESRFFSKFRTDYITPYTWNAVCARASNRYACVSGLISQKHSVSLVGIKFLHTHSKTKQNKAKH